MDSACWLPLELTSEAGVLTLDPDLSDAALPSLSLTCVCLDSDLDSPFSMSGLLHALIWDLGVGGLDSFWLLSILCLDDARLFLDVLALDTVCSRMLSGLPGLDDTLCPVSSA